jgi:nitroreductase
MFIDLLRKRRSIRKYKKTEIAKNKLDILIEALLLSPTSRGINPWEFIIVDDPNLLISLSKAKIHGSEFLKDAAIGIVICADEKKSDVWIEDCSIAAIILQLTAESLDLSSCWIQIRNRMHNKKITSEEYIRNQLNIPENIKIESIIAIGYPDEKKKPYSRNYLNFKKIFLNKYNKNYYNPD